MKHYKNTLHSFVIKILKITFLHFSLNLFLLFQRNLVGTLFGIKGTFSGTQMTLTVENGSHFKVKKLQFLHLFWTNKPQNGIKLFFYGVW